MKLEFGDGRTTVNSGRTSDYNSSAVSVKINNWPPNPQDHALVLEGYNTKGRLIKGDL